MNQLIEKIIRSAYSFSVPRIVDSSTHPFCQRDIHPSIPSEIRRLFDNSHYAQATFEASKFLDRVVANLSKSAKSGQKLMMDVFDPGNPILKLNALANESDTDEQNGYRFLFSGTIIGIRNPRGHEVAIQDTVSECLECLELITHLLRKLEKAGYTIPNIEITED